MIDSGELYINPVIGFRVFHLTQSGSLKPIARGQELHSYVPDGRRFQAQCACGLYHPVPDPKCSCGFWAYNHPSWIIDRWVGIDMFEAVSTVLLTGRIVVGERGYRAQFMQLGDTFIVDASLPRSYRNLRTDEVFNESIWELLLASRERLKADGAAVLAFCSKCEAKGCKWCRGTGMHPDLNRDLDPPSRVFRKMKSLESTDYDDIANIILAEPKVADPESANLITSELTNGLHAPAIDLDKMAVRLVESRTKDGKHWHLLIDKEMPWEDYVELLEVMVKIGLVEPGYLKASKARGYTALRFPHVDSPRNSTL